MWQGFQNLTGMIFFRFKLLQVKKDLGGKIQYLNRD